MRKQGRADIDGSGVPYGRKVEPYGHVVNVKAVSQIGSSMGNHSTDHGTPLPRGVTSDVCYQGKVGFQAPPDQSDDVHDCGSQGCR